MAEEDLKVQGLGFAFAERVQLSPKQAEIEARALEHEEREKAIQEVNYAKVLESIKRERRNDLIEQYAGTLSSTGKFPSAADIVTSAIDLADAVIEATKDE